MNPMTLTVGWQDVVLRLAVALAAGVVIGLNRGESGKAAGLRTTLLVCLAACIAMLQVNVLLPQAGKPDGSFVELDLMRLPLGILSGVGFIGAGAIMRRDGLVTGVTTAATLWFVTVIGLCAGGGQIALAMTALLLGILVLLVLGLLERRLPRHRQASLTIEYDRSTDTRTRLIEQLNAHACDAKSQGVRLVPATTRVEERFEIKWRAPLASNAVEQLLSGIVERHDHAAAWSTAD
ncbi:MgtC/SapB family protein [Paraburkholderia sp. BCC1886]|uniref:MgtC/SapB family protein n=1 Tax=Paraburkholderia sp. BCC1886 TaxID=2562670 RepID=UPI0011833529|nr:MgtC/SapB family protein [Paraburkholderia sp. BCC1886]